MHGPHDRATCGRPRPRPLCSGTVDSRFPDAASLIRATASPLTSCTGSSGNRSTTVVPLSRVERMRMRAAVQLGQRFGDGEAEAGALVRLGEQALDLLERAAELLQRRLAGCRCRCPRTRGRPSRPRRAARTRTRPPSGVNFTAFDSRLSAICLMARLSARSLMPGARSHDQRELLRLGAAGDDAHRIGERPARSRPPRSRA